MENYSVAPSECVATESQPHAELVPIRMYWFAHRFGNVKPFGGEDLGRARLQPCRKPWQTMRASAPEAIPSTAMEADADVRSPSTSLGEALTAPSARLGMTSARGLPRT